MIKSMYYSAKKQIYYYKNKAKLGLSKKDYNRLTRKHYNYKEMLSIGFSGQILEINSPYWFMHSLEEIYLEEVYRFLPSREDVVILDCGANIGLSVLYFKQKYPKSRIIAFEPDPEVFKLLQGNVSRSKVENVELRNQGIWVDNSEISFESEGTVGGKIEVSGDNLKNKVMIKTTRLRDYLTTKIDFLKIDIEGAEYNVLKDCQDLLFNVENLFIEYHVALIEEQKLDEILLWIKKAGFRYYIKHAWNNQLFPFMKENLHSYEMQLNIFCYRR